MLLRPPCSRIRLGRLQRRRPSVHPAVKSGCAVPAPAAPPNPSPSSQPHLIPATGLPDSRSSSSAGSLSASLALPVLVTGQPCPGVSCCSCCCCLRPKRRLHYGLLRGGQRPDFHYRSVVSSALIGVFSAAAPISEQTPTCMWSMHRDVAACKPGPHSLIESYNSRNPRI